MSNEKHMGMPHTAIDTNAKSQTRAYYMSAGGQKRWLGPWRNCTEDAQRDQNEWTARHNGETPAPETETDSATPRPWVLNTDVDSVWIYGANAEPVYDDSEPSEIEPLSKDDAALIVAAVNSRDRLVEACKRATQELEDFLAAIRDMGLQDRFVDDRTNMMSNGDDATEIARAALALARGD